MRVDRSLLCQCLHPHILPLCCLCPCIRFMSQVDYNLSFKLYITTKIANPHYTPEVSTKVSVGCATRNERAVTHW